MRTHVVVDTNVLLVASAKDDRADALCVRNCTQKLKNIRDSGALSIDSGFRIINEYRKGSSLSGQPGPGDQFLLWIWTNMFNPDICESVDFTSRSGSDDDFHEFPDDPALANFDRSDRKFVAVSLASEHRPPILNATDSDWSDHREALEKHGVVIKFLCPDAFKPR